MECDRKQCKIAQNCPCKCVPNAKMLYCTPKKKLETIEDLKVLLEDCMVEFWEKDSCLMTNRVSEPTVSGRFAMIVFDILNRKYDLDEKLCLDVEYGSHWSKKKNVEVVVEHIKHSRYIYLDNNKELIEALENSNPKKNIRPDIVLHKRKKDKGNFFVIELKCFRGKVNNFHVDNRYKYDYAKLIVLTYPIEKSNSEKSFYGYKYGIHLTICQDGTLIKIFQNAQHIYSDSILKKE